MAIKNECPSCLNERDLFIFYAVKDLPVFQNVTYKSYEESINCKRGDLDLTYCPRCGMVFNSSFDKNLMDYSKDYDNEQSFSKCFSNYVDGLINIFQDEYGLENKTILEIGCGKGAFIKKICEKTNSKGFGFDSTYDGIVKSNNVIYKSRYFGKQDAPFKADFIFLRHVLEHIDNPFCFLSEIISNIDKSQKSKLVIELPDFEWIVTNKVYWDIFYEHCNYFTKHSLQFLVQSLGIKIDALFNTFNGQYMVLIGTIGSSESSSVKEAPIIPKELLNTFSNDILFKKHSDIANINRFPASEDFVIWGAASKGVVFLINLDDKTRKKIKFVVDINKGKQGRYTAVTGKQIKSPEALKNDVSVKHIIIMNPNYENEILEMLKKIDRNFVIHIF